MEQGNNLKLYIYIKLFVKEFEKVREKELL